MTSPGDPADRWERVKELFHRALERDPAERSSFLAAAAGDDAALRAEVESLLAADAAPATLLDQRLAGVVGEVVGRDLRRDLAGRTVGSYRLLEELGRGGMAVVHAAARADDEYRRQVAVKLIRRGLDSEPIVARFRQERQILADLDHPGIARLYDGGITDEGLPYLVMERVDGEPIDRYCDRRGLDWTARLELFLKVAAAVEYAHRNLVVHRDLKPSNILVTADGEPKLLDFGIAKLLDPADPALGATAVEERPMTPEYASPEQVAGRPITTASDVYSLGVLLYRLLTGSRPYRLERPTRAAIERAICEEEPERPSSVVRRATGGERTGADGARLARALQGDLDQIVAKALAKEPERRYASVERLAEDVRRHLEGRPVSARGDSTAYRARKFVRRHRGGVAAAGLVALSLVIGLVTAAWQAHRASLERRRSDVQARLARSEQAKAERVVDFLVGLFEVADPGETLGASITARELLDRGAAKIEQGLADRPEVQAAVLGTVGTVYVKLGLFDRAEPLLERSVEVRRQLFGEAHPEVAVALSDLAELRRTQGRLGEAEALLRRCLEMRRRQLGAESPLVAESREDLAQVLQEEGQYDEAETLLRRSLAARRAAGADGGRLVKPLNTLALVLKERSRYDEAEALLRQALSFGSTSLPAEHPDLARLRKNLASVLRAKGAYGEARAMYEEILADERRVLGDSHPSLATTLNNLAGCLADLGEYDRAEELLERSLELRREALQPEHPDVAESLNNLARIAYQRGQLGRAEELARRGLALLRKLDDGHPNLAVAANNLAAILERGGRLDEAEELYREALARNRSTYGEASLKVASNLNNLGFLAQRRGDHTAAVEHYRKALAIQRSLLGDDHLEIARVRKNLAQSLLLMGAAEDAAAEFRRALAVYAALALDPRPPEEAFARSWLGRALLQLDRPIEAEPELRRAAAAWEALGARGKVGLGVTRSVLGDCLARLGKEGDAERSLTEGYRLLRDIVGERHPETVAARGRLEAFRAARRNHKLNETVSP